MFVITTSMESTLPGRELKEPGERLANRFDRSVDDTLDRLYIYIYIYILLFYIDIDR